jgi:exopolyphosphatase / guanosine-5'-triphosphate,3'-diphosphate pyrophosphatase
VFVIDQELEGKLAFNATLSQGNYDPTKLIVWDIGGGSLQLTALDNRGEYIIFRGDIASIQFKNNVIQDVQHQDVNKVTTPNPMNVEEMQKSVLLAREVAQKVDRVFKERLQQNPQIVGVGNIFAYGIYPIVGKKSPFTQEELYKATMNMANKDDQQVGGGDYANVQVTNAILVLGYMQTLGINHMEALDINNADGALLYGDFWS